MDVEEGEALIEEETEVAPVAVSEEKPSPEQGDLEKAEDDVTEEGE